MSDFFDDDDGDYAHARYMAIQEVRREIYGDIRSSHDDTWGSHERIDERIADAPWEQPGSWGKYAIGDGGRTLSDEGWIWEEDKTPKKPSYDEKWDEMYYLSDSDNDDGASYDDASYDVASYDDAEFRNKNT